MVAKDRGRRSAWRDRMQRGELTADEITERQLEELGHFDLPPMPPAPAAVRRTMERAAMVGRVGTGAGSFVKSRLTQGKPTRPPPESKAALNRKTQKKSADADNYEMMRARAISDWMHAPAETVPRVCEALYRALSDDSGGAVLLFPDAEQRRQ